MMFCNRICKVLVSFLGLFLFATTSVKCEEKKESSIVTSGEKISLSYQYYTIFGPEEVFVLFPTEPQEFSDASTSYRGIYSTCYQTVGQKVEPYRFGISGKVNTQDVDASLLLKERLEFLQKQENLKIVSSCIMQKQGYEVIEILYSSMENGDAPTVFQEQVVITPYFTYTLFSQGPKEGSAELFAKFFDSYRITCQK